MYRLLHILSFEQNVIVYVCSFVIKISMYALRKQPRVAFIRRALVVVTTVGFVLSVVLANLPVQAQQEPVTWLNTTKQPGIEPGKTIDENEYQRLLGVKRGFSAGLTCIEKRVAILRLANTNIVYSDGCWHQTKLGLLEQGGRYLLEPGTTMAGRIRGNAQDTSTLHPTPNPDVFLELIEDAATGYGNFVQFRTVETATFDHEIAINSAINLSYRHTVGVPRLRTASSGSVNVQNSEVWYSQNGTWMLVGTNDGVVYRINLQELTVLGIRFSDKPSGAQLPIMADITNDGRYIAVSVNGQPRSELFIIDTSQCSEAETVINAVVTGTCATRQLKSGLQTVITSYHSIVLPRFYGNDTLGIYHREGSEYRQYILQAPDTVASGWDYIALGDSFASGEGAFDYMYGTDDPNNKCHTSLRSYPYLIEREVNLTSFYSAACSGALIEHIIAGTDTNNHRAKPSEAFPNKHPGYLRQIEQLSKNTDIVTISIAGNDIGFSDRIKYCVAGNAHCFATHEDRAEIIQEINRQYERLAGKNGVYTKLRDAAAPNAKIYVIGYPQTMYTGEDENCAVNVRLNAYQRTMAQQLVEYLNAVIRHAAHDAGVQYVDVERALDGHRLCQTASAATAVNGITAGNDLLLVIGSESYHPNELGHQLMQKAILQQTDYFTKPMPPVPAQKLGLPNAADYAFSQGIRTGRLTVSLYYIGHDFVPIHYREGTIRFELGGLFDVALSFTPQTDYNVFLHSDPVKLGTITSDELGTLRGTFTIPDSVEPGMHTLRITGKGVDGHQIELYKYVYIGVHEEDWDGDGVPNDQEACGIFDPVGQDSDKDGIDDACDPLITDTPSRPDNTSQLPVKTRGTIDLDRIRTQLKGVIEGLPSRPASVQSQVQNLFPEAYPSAVQGVSATTHSPDVTVSRIKVEQKSQSWLPSVIAACFTLITLLLYAKTKQRNHHA